MRLFPTPSQTIGPFFRFALPYNSSEHLVTPGTQGAITIEGQVFDGEGTPVPDAMIEIWQADRVGRYTDPKYAHKDVAARDFTGFGRCCTDPAGRFRFVTVKPGRVPLDGQFLAPHINLSIFARGLLRRLVTRMYFPDEAEANAADPVLAAIDSPAVRSTLLARAEQRGALRFDIHLQGDRETAFFAL